MVIIIREIGTGCDAPLECRAGGGVKFAPSDPRKSYNFFNFYDQRYFKLSPTPCTDQTIDV
jgi:hypothetical protein